MESSILSPNRELYGDLHNQGHVLLAFLHDPDHRYLESFALMGDTTTAMRDPIFYRWHAFIDELFQLHKEKLPPYTTQQIGFPNIRVTDVTVQPKDGPAGTLQTHWQKSDVDLSNGMDFVPRGNVYAQ